MDSTNLIQPPRAPSLLSRVQANLFGNVLDSLVSIVCGVLLVMLVYSVIDWAFISSIWRAEDESLCKEAGGACWSVIDARHRIIFFGLFPFEEHWRSL